MSSAVTTTFDVAAPPEAVKAAVQKVIAENRATIDEQAPDGAEVAFTTRKTMFTWELYVYVAVNPGPSGSSVSFHLDTAPGRPKAMMDGKKNRKAADKLIEQIKAAV